MKMTAIVVVALRVEIASFGRTLIYPAVVRKSYFSHASSHSENVASASRVTLIRSSGRKLEIFTHKNWVGLGCAQRNS